MPKAEPTTIIALDPDTQGWVPPGGANDSVISVKGGFNDTLNSIRGSGIAKNQFWILTMGPDADERFSDMKTIGDIAEITFTTKKNGGQGDPDWYVLIYTAPYDRSPGGWYGNRVQAEPYFSANPNAPANQWTTWSTRVGTNQLRWGDSSSGDFSDNIGVFSTLKTSDVEGGTGTYGDAEIKYFSFGTGSEWADGFTGELGTLHITLTNGDIIEINMGEPEPEPEPQVTASACFTEDAVVKTDQGLFKIKDITTDQTIGNKSIKGISKTIYSQDKLVVIEKDAFDENKPNKKILVAPFHRFLINDKLKMAFELVNNDTIYLTKYHNEYLYNVILEKHQTMEVNNIKAETLDPTSLIAQLFNGSLSKTQRTKLLKSFNKYHKQLKNKPIKTLKNYIV